MSAGNGFGEARVVSCILLQILPYVVPLELREEAPDVLFIFELGGVRCWDFDGLDLGIELCNIEEVTSTTATLLSSDKGKTRVAG